MQLRAAVAIDLGTVSTHIWAAGRGLVIEEPSAIAVDTITGSVAGTGTDADALAGKEPQNIEVIYPVRSGVIVDLDAATAMLHAFLKRAGARSLRKASALVCVPSGATWVERRAVAATLTTRRPGYAVRLVDQPVAVAAGAGFELTRGAGAFVVDIGGGTAEVAAVAGGRVVRSQSLRKAGNTMDEAIMRATKEQMGLILGQKAAAALKTTMGLTGGSQGSAEAVGLDASTRAPRVEQVPGQLVADALEPIVTSIAEAVREVLSDIPPGLAEDVVRGKVCLSGGGALLPGLASRIEETAGIGALVVDDPLRCLVRGAADLLEHKDRPAPAGLATP